MGLFNKIHKQQGGQTIILTLIVLVLASIMIVPLLNLMNTGIKSTQVYQDNTEEIYAADSGFQKAIWEIQNDPNIINDQKNATYGSTYTYPPFTVNNCSVSISVDSIWLLSGIVNMTNGTYPHDTWYTMGMEGTANLSSSPSVPGVFTLTFSYDGSGNKKIDYMGVWLPNGFTYVHGSSGNSALIHQITSGEPSQTEVYGGTSLVWNVQPNFSFVGLSPPTAEQQFEFLPGNAPPIGAAAWVKSQSQDIGYQWDNALWWYQITSTATDPSNNKVTTVESMVVNNVRDGSLNIVSYVINPS